jgi:hypothetical protein
MTKVEIEFNDKELNDLKKVAIKYKISLEELIKKLAKDKAREIKNP